MISTHSNVRFAHDNRDSVVKFNVLLLLYRRKLEGIEHNVLRLYSEHFQATTSIAIVNVPCSRVND